MRQKWALSRLRQFFAFTAFLVCLAHEMFTCCNKRSDSCQRGWIHAHGMLSGEGDGQI